MSEPASQTSAAILVSVLVLFPIGFVAFWSFVCLVLGLVSGWMGLAGRCRTELPAPAGSDSGVSGMLGFVSYNHVLEVGFAEDGLDLRVMMLFRPGHAPLRIPWEQVRHEGPAFSLWGRFVKVRLGEGGPLLRLPAEVWARSGRWMAAPVAP